jgi:hypothetical protein
MPAWLVCFRIYVPETYYLVMPTDLFRGRMDRRALGALSGQRAAIFVLIAAFALAVCDRQAVP